MKWFDKVERKLGRYAIPNLMRYMVIVSIIGSVLGLVVPGFYEMYLSLNVYAILHGQVWRIVTFLFYPYVSIGSGGALINMIFFGIMLYVYYWIGNMLEQIWGRFRFNAFYFTGILLILIMTFGYYFVVCHANGQALAPQIGFELANQIDLSDLNLSMFLAFAFLFPDTVFRLYFLIPIKAKWLGYIYILLNVVEIVQYAQTGDYRGAIQDYSTVINQHPNFLAGYYQRAEARKKIGDRKGAEQDEFKLLKAQLDKQNGVTNKDVAQNQNPDQDSEGDDKDRTRKKSDKNMNNYRKIVIADDSEAEQRYTSDYRGRVQDKNVNITLEPMFALTYYEKMSDVKRSVNFHKYVEELNRSGVLPKRLRITNMEAPLTEEQVKFHFALIDTHTSAIVDDEKNASKRFARAIDFYLVQDFSSAVSDLTQTILLDGDFFPAYFMRALIRCKQLEYQKAEQTADTDVPGDNARKEITAVDYEVVRKDLDKVINLAPDFVYAYYNRANVSAMLKDYRSAIADYNKAIELNPDFADAYFNRGLTHIFLGNNKLGISDLSKAGELGIVSAYNVIKRFTDQTE